MAGENRWRQGGAVRVSPRQGSQENQRDSAAAQPLQPNCRPQRRRRQDALPRRQQPLPRPLDHRRPGVDQHAEIRVALDCLQGFERVAKVLVGLLARAPGPQPGPSRPGEQRITRLHAGGRQSQPGTVEVDRQLQSKLEPGPPPGRLLARDLHNSGDLAARLHAVKGPGGQQTEERATKRHHVCINEQPRPGQAAGGR